MFGKSKRNTETRRHDAEPPESPAPPPIERTPLPRVLQEPVVKPSIITDSVNFVGDLRSIGPLHIDGQAKGTIEAESVTVGTVGAFDGTVNCKKLHIKGRLSGEINCDELIIGDEAQVKGSLSCKTIRIRRGARVAGDFAVIAATLAQA